MAQEIDGSRSRGPVNPARDHGSSRACWPPVSVWSRSASAGSSSLGLVGTSIGVGGVVVGALCALLPVGPVVAAFLWVDRWEPEPPRLLLLAFLWGACFAALAHC